jgi:hypothetical protein
MLEVTTKVSVTMQQHNAWAAPNSRDLKSLIERSSAQSR